VRNGGDVEMPRQSLSSRPSCLKVGAWANWPANPPTGFEPACESVVRSTCAGVGTLQAGDSRSRTLDQVRAAQANPGRGNSSTMKGPIARKGLPVSLLGDVAENAALCGRNGPLAVAKGDGRGVRGSFCVLPPEIANTAIAADSRKLCRGGSLDIRPASEGSPPLAA
jgi:hypothetical protein